MSPNSEFMAPLAASGTLTRQHGEERKTQFLQHHRRPGPARTGSTHLPLA